MTMIRSIRGRRVLVVDAELDTTSTLFVLFNQLGYETRCTHRGRHALRLVRDFDPDLILIDTDLPDLSGYEVARALRASPTRSDRYVAAITARDPDDLERVKRAGFDECLRKPVDVAKLRRVLGAVSERRRDSMN